MNNHSQDILEHFAAGRRTLSFEFFPPRTPAASHRLLETISELRGLAPHFIHVTYGAGGSTRELTHELVVRIHRETGLPVVPHLTCVGSRPEEIHDILSAYDREGIHTIMALRGDPPRDHAGQEDPHHHFPYASDLVGFIRHHFPHMRIGVAGYPEGHRLAPNRLKEMAYLRDKVDAGADYLVTQIFFDNRDYLDFVERCRLQGIQIPVLPGLMPITSLANMERMSELSPGTRFPARLLRHLLRAGDEGDGGNVERAGLHWTAEQVRDLLDRGVPGLHFYTLNRSDQIRGICQAIGIDHSRQLERDPDGLGS